MQPLFQVPPQFLLWIFLHPCVITCPAQRRSTLGARELRLDRWSARRLRRPGDGRQLAAGELDKVRRELAAYREFAVLSEALVAVNEAICEARPVAGRRDRQQPGFPRRRGRRKRGLFDALQAAFTKVPVR